MYSRCKVLSSYLTLALEIKLSNRYIYLFFSMLHSASTFLSKCSFRSFLFALSSSITRTSVNYVQKGDGFLASVQTCVVNFLLWLLLELSSFLVWLHWCSVFVFAYIIYIFERSSSSSSGKSTFYSVLEDKRCHDSAWHWIHSACMAVHK